MLSDEFFYHGSIYILIAPSRYHDSSTRAEAGKPPPVAEINARAVATIALIRSGRSRPYFSQYDYRTSDLQRDNLSVHGPEHNKLQIKSKSHLHVHQATVDTNYSPAAGFSHRPCHCVVGEVASSCLPLTVVTNCIFYDFSRQLRLPYLRI